MTTKICLVGIGKIARDQHVPAIMHSTDWELAATVSRSGSVDGVPAFDNIDTFLESQPNIHAVSLCLPPVPRFEFAASAIAAGRHVMLEKPPGATIAEVHELQRMAEEAGVTLFATWHSRAAQAVKPAKAWLSNKTITKAHINWKEDVRTWHPGQEWVFSPGGMGVFDPGINALSIITEILPFELRLQEARLAFPSNRDTPIAADLIWDNHVTGAFDWRQTGQQSWDITVETTEGELRITEGGTRLITNDSEEKITLLGEYPSLYNRMASLVKNGQSDIDLRPLVHVADAFMIGKRITVEAFHF